MFLQIIIAKGDIVLYYLYLQAFSALFTNYLFLGENDRLIFHNIFTKFHNIFTTILIICLGREIYVFISLRNSFGIHDLD